MSTQEQGFYLTAQFDRMTQRTRKDKEGREYLTFAAGFIVRTDDETQLVSVKTKRKESYEQFKSGDLVTVRVWPRAYKDFLYFQDYK